MAACSMLLALPVWATACSLEESFEGVSISMLYPGWVSGSYLQAIHDFANHTGLEVNLQGYSYGSFFEEVSLGVKSGQHDVVNLLSSWIPEFASQGYLHELDDLRQESDLLEWSDIMWQKRRSGITYRSNLYGIPIDGDTIVSVMRKDLLEEFGFPIPSTWDDVVDISNFFYGKDLNGDGEADFGTCLCMESTIGSASFISLLVAYMQGQGSSQGAFFDPTTMEPYVDNPGFREAMRIFKNISATSNEHGRPGPAQSFGDVTKLFLEGRCVFHFDYVGVIMFMMKESATYGLLGKLTIQAMPAASRVVHKGALTKCTAAICFQGSRNPTPYIPGGHSHSIVEAAVEGNADKIKAAWGLVCYLSTPEVSIQAVAGFDTFIDPYRDSDFSKEHSPLFKVNGWNTETLASLQQAVTFNFNSGNAVSELEIFGAARCSDTLRKYIDLFIRDESSMEDTIQAIATDWSAVIELYGFREQRGVYRASLNLPILQEEEDNFNADENQQRVIWALTSLTTCAGLILSAALLLRFQEPTFHDPIMLSFLAMLIPDFVYSLTYFPVSLRNILLGAPLAAKACEAVAFLHYGTVVSTFMGPVTVSLVVYRQIARVTDGVMHGEATSKATVIALLVVPWVAGFVLAGVVKSQNLLGSYRGLYCYATSWDHPLTGGLTFSYLLVCCFVTGLLYVLLYRKVNAARSTSTPKSSGSGVSVNTNTLVLKKGATLVAVLFSTWFMWCVCGYKYFRGSPLSVEAEIVGAVLISFQSIIDFFIVARHPQMRTSLLKCLQLTPTRSTRSTRTSNASAAVSMSPKASARSPIGSRT